MQLIPGAIVKIKTSREYGTVIRHSKMSDFIYAIDANPNFPRHYAVLTQNGHEQAGHCRRELPHPATRLPKADAELPRPARQTTDTRPAL